MVYKFGHGPHNATWWAGGLGDPYSKWTDRGSNLFSRDDRLVNKPDAYRKWNDIENIA